MTGSIYYFCTLKHIYALGIFTVYFADELESSIKIIPYGALPSIDAFGPGVYIFTDFDRLHNKTLQRSVATFIDTLQAHGCPILNDPARALRRFDLLRTLHEAGINDFNVYRVEDWQKVTHFPCFIRQESGHEKPLTKLIDKKEVLAGAIRELLKRGHDHKDLMISEFSNARYPDGKYRKYSAYGVGDTIYPQHVFASDDWYIKFSNTEASPEEWREHNDYVAQNPHADQLKRVFELANTQYGRVDYCVVNGRVQVFEINTNPTVIQSDAIKRRGDMKHYSDMHADALRKLLEHAAGPERLPNPVYNPDNPEKRTSSPEEVSAELLDWGRGHWEKYGPRPAPAEAASA